MSRIGKAPIEIPAGVTVTVDKDNVVTVKGPKGTLSQTVNPDLTVAVEDGHVTPCAAWPIPCPHPQYGCRRVYRLP